MARVLVRIRRQEMQSTVRSIANAPSATQSWGAGEAAHVLRPSQKSVQARHSRLAPMRGGIAKISAALFLRLNLIKAAGATLLTRIVHIRPRLSSRRVSKTPEQAPSGMSQLTSAASQVPRAIATWRAKISSLNRVLPRRSPDTTAELSPLSEDTPLHPAEHSAPIVEAVPSLTERVVSSIRTRVIDLPNPSKVETVAVAREIEPNTSEISKDNDHQPRRRRLMNNAKKKASPIEEASQALAAEQYQAAEDILISYIVHHTKDVGAYMLLGKAAAGRGEWNEAVEIFEQVIAWNPKLNGAYEALGNAACRAGRYTRALQALQRAHEADPANISVVEQLMSIAQKMDNVPLQNALKKKLIELTPSERTGVR